jgi:transcriptional regulator with XRE-family HTH domain
MAKPTLGDLLRAHREANALEQGDLARRLNVSAKAIQRWENGHVEPTGKNRLALVTLLGLDDDWSRGRQSGIGDLPAILSPADARQAEASLKTLVHELADRMNIKAAELRRAFEHLLSLAEALDLSPATAKALLLGGTDRRGRRAQPRSKTT